MADTEYEYGIRSVHYPEPHRAGMTEKQATEWITTWIEDGGIDGVFSVIKRPLPDWEEEKNLTLHSVQEGLRRRET